MPLTPELNLDISSLLIPIIQEHAEHTDIIVRAGDITLAESWDFREPGVPLLIHGNQISFTRRAYTQLLQRLEIPSEFFYRNPFDIQRALLSYWLLVNVNRKFLIRLDIETDIAKLTRDPFVRAVLGPRYTTKADDYFLVPAIISSLLDLGYNFRIGNCSTNTGNGTWSFYTFHLAIPALPCLGEPGHSVQARLRIVNSEVGLSSIRIDPVVCLDSDLEIAPWSGGETTRFVHRSGLDLNDIKDAIRRAYERVQVGMLRLAEAAPVSISQEEAVQFVESIDPLSERIEAIVLESLEKTPVITELVLAKNLLNAAKSLPLWDRMQVQAAINQRLNLFSPTESGVDYFRDRMVAIAAED
jgi:hypothetical protein